MKSRLARHQRKTFSRQAVVFFVMAVGVIVLVFKWGIPGLVKLAIFLGDLKSSTQKVQQADAIPPIPPRFAALPTATFSATLTVRGFSEAGTKVVVTVNGIDKADVVADNDGEFVIDTLALNNGDNKVQAVATDQAGNQSQLSQAVMVMVDTEALQLTLETPADKTSTTDETIEVKGKISKPEAEVRVNGRFVATDKDGQFTTKVLLNQGDNTINVVATDRAGNQTNQTITVTRQSS